MPRGGVPPLVTTVTELDDAATRLAAGSGPIAVDTERASGFRYDERAFLIQIKRSGTGIILIDPVNLRDDIPHILGPVVNTEEWIIHAATTDLGCLYELGLAPSYLFDTELAGRFCGVERVNLASMVENFLGHTLKKGYGAADWSTRPLPADWLVYAALDVELLIELKHALVPVLEQNGTRHWFDQECEHIRHEFSQGDPHPKKTWRDTKRISKVRKPNQLAVLKALWQHRDKLAARQDVASSKILSDRIMVEIAIATPRTRAHLLSVSKKNGSYIKQPDRWIRVINQTLKTPPESWPRPSRRRPDEAPARKDWAHLNPEAFSALETVSASLQEVSDRYTVPLEKLIKPATLREILWAHHEGSPLRGESDLNTALDSHEVRSWQKEIVAPIIATALGL